MAKKLRTPLVQFNNERAEQIFRVLANLWEKNAGIFKNVTLPQFLWDAPKEPRDAAHFFFAAAHTMRGPSVSEDPFKWVVKLFVHYPELLESGTIVGHWCPERIANAVYEVTQAALNGKGVGTGKHGALAFKITEIANAWHKNAHTIVRRFNGNVLNIFDGVRDFEEAFARIDHARLGSDGIIGMRRKIFSLFTIWLQERGIIPTFPTPIPVDFHALRILWTTGVITLPTKPIPCDASFPEALWGRPSVRPTESLKDEVALWSQEFLTRHHLSHLSVNPALWVLGRTLCSGQLQNQTRGGGTFFYTPEALAAPNGRKLWPRSYPDPCGICPIASSCTGASPSWVHYQKGVLVWFDRIPYPGTPLLDGLDWQHHVGVKSRKGRRPQGETSWLEQQKKHQRTRNW
ncbi:MAG: hypothetical protein Q7S84_04705 [bacterium]|nr:hypothetical protein [bacterium]